MVYIILLNWKNAVDTIDCLKSLKRITDIENKIIVCDNNSPDDSLERIKDFIKGDDFYSKSFLDLSGSDNKNHKLGYKITLIATDKNLGFAGGNNVATKIALSQSDADYIWLLNNDTEVEPNSLSEIIKRFRKNPKIGVCGSKLVYSHQRDKIQGLGGLINPFTCATKHIPWLAPSKQEYNDEEMEKQISYVLGASMMFSRAALENVGLLCEDYFLYYEEVDMCNRLKKAGFELGVASKSIVYHKEGASTNYGKSDVADYCSVRNRILIAKKFYPSYILTVKLSLLGVIFNRLKRREFKRALNYIKFFNL
ncbi:glycosyltransferase family 2 protein [Klebsiella quasipneumoniae subsp. quasipneumoniae]|uniref:glycosyltransferase family 2 protein n=1 Tax=Klebsiella quasipneumoniae TaxID=1463165 RepID=UPI001FB6836F|nr:glycosyltransferase family 2 protein [Klebsiella quasipneumoniae]MCJ1823497.1 glycosyltransferase family 2 protein [Klebsiella quasipneumoniae subsp. quasipneumoniae]